MFSFYMYVSLFFEAHGVLVHKQLRLLVPSDTLEYLSSEYLALTATIHI